MRRDASAVKRPYFLLGRLLLRLSDCIAANGERGNGHQYASAADVNNSTG